MSMKYIASCSFGKDSLATILLALEHNEPLDTVIWSEVMFDNSENISGEIPEHVEWIYNTAIPQLQSMGLNVEVLRSEKDYMYFFHKVRSGKYKGKLSGFPLGGKCIINSECKVKPIHKYYKTIDDSITQYVGIAIDEPNRLERLKHNQVSLLAKYGYTEQMAKDLCIEHGLLSPIYASTNRGGCFFCPNRRYKTFAIFKQEHPELWSRLLELGKTPNLCSYSFKYGKTIEWVDKKIDEINMQLELF